MTPATPKDPGPDRSRNVLTTAPSRSARAMRTSTLTLLVVVVVVIAVTMVGSAVRFVLAPDPAVKAGPMYVVLAMLTVASLLMALLAVNATFYRVLDRRQVNDVSLVMWTMAAVGVVVGILALGGAVNSLVVRLCVSTTAYVFIWMQAVRIEKARAAQAAGHASAPVRRPAAAPAQPKGKHRQRRGGRKH
jgi:hypothetical protein